MNESYAEKDCHAIVTISNLDRHFTARNLEDQLLQHFPEDIVQGAFFDFGGSELKVIIGVDHSSLEEEKNAAIEHLDQALAASPFAGKVALWSIITRCGVVSES